MAELIQREDSLNTGREKLNEAIKASKRAESKSDYAVDTAETALSNSESTQTQLDTIVIDGDSSVEAAQARVDSEGNTYNTLKERLDDKETEFSSQLAHTWKNIHTYPRLDNEQTDTGRLKRMISELENGDTIYLPNTNDPYLLDDTITIDKNINIRSEGVIKYIGSKDKPVLHFIRPVNTTIDITRIESENIIDWGNENYVGVFLTNAYMTTVNIGQILGFDVGFKAQALKGLADNGFWFNKIRIKRINNCRIGQELNSDGDGAWLNANEFYDTSIGYNSGSPKTTITDRYNIKQTLTNGNNYGGNNNYFYNYKLETHGGFSGTHTMVEITKAIDWLFKDFRREVTNSSSNEREFVFNMLSNREDIITKHAHTNGVKINGLYRFKIEYDNVGQLKASLHEIVTQNNTQLKTVFDLTHPSKNAKRVNVNNSILPNFVSSSTTNQALNSESPVFYRPDGIKDGDSIRLTPSGCLTLYLDDLKDKDTIRIESASSNMAVQAYDIDGTIVENVRNHVSGFLTINNDNNSIIPHSNSDLEFSIKGNTIKTLKIKLYGKIENIKIQTDSEIAKIKKTMNANLFINGDYYSDIKPVYHSDYGFKVGDVVLNSKDSLTTPDAWQLQFNNGQYVWVDIG